MKIGSLLATLALPALAIAACNGTPLPAACTDIPTGGCPEDNGAEVCSDCTCDSVYACNNGTWVFAQKCPSRPACDAGTSADAASSSDAGITDAPAPQDVPFDVPPGAYGGPGCTDLETPDCSVGAAIACAATPDCCGCIDLWVCQGGGWVSWGTCADGGLVANK